MTFGEMASFVANERIITLTHLSCTWGLFRFFCTSGVENMLESDAAMLLCFALCSRCKLVSVLGYLFAIYLQEYEAILLATRSCIVRMLRRIVIDSC